MVIESRERARRNAARYPQTTNQRYEDKHPAPQIINRSQPVRDTGKPVRRRNHKTYHAAEQRARIKGQLLGLAVSVLLLLGLGIKLYFQFKR